MCGTGATCTTGAKGVKILQVVASCSKHLRAIIIKQLSYICKLPDKKKSIANIRYWVCHIASLRQEVSGQHEKNMIKITELGNII